MPVTVGMPSPSPQAPNTHTHALFGTIPDCHRGCSIYSFHFRSPTTSALYHPAGARSVDPTSSRSAWTIERPSVNTHWGSPTGHRCPPDLDHCLHDRCHVQAIPLTSPSLHTSFRNLPELSAGSWAGTAGSRLPLPRQRRELLSAAPRRSPLSRA